jgi:hypothetical protein
MQLPSRDVFTHLLQSGVTHLHHANTVTTSCEFIRKKQLIARGCMDRLGLNQTPQASDANDKVQGVYFDIFLDSVDIHNRASRRNLYGPVLFKLSVERLRAMDLPPLWVTRSNPINWNDNTTQQDKWFQNFTELQLEFVVGRFNQMIVLRHIGGVLPLTDCLEDIVLDEPQMNDAGLDYFALSTGAILLARTSSPTPLPFAFHKRDCAAGCACITEYQGDRAATLELFVPRRTTPPPPPPALNPPNN